ncbi:MAG: citrate lyase ligase [Deltaproteobacteria bacterium]|nr:citrate lyase ligase [Deltaproteobacteria bacterium]
MIVDLLSQGDRQHARALIEGAGLSFEADVEELVGVHEDGVLVGTAARQGDVLKLFAIDPAAQGGGLLGELAGDLLRRAFEAGHESVFVFTKPEYAGSFEQLNFELLATAGQAALLEHGGGLSRYLEAQRGLLRPGKNGAVVVNANPFTLGHRYLVEEAAARCDTLYVFVVEEDRSAFPFELRRRLVAAGCADLQNVKVLGSGHYAVSAQTFPSYFLKRDEDIPALQMEIDLTLFSERIAPFFSLGARFVGHEPYCTTTRQYNETMQQVLPRCGLELQVIERRLVGADQPGGAESDKAFISATRVRQALREEGPSAPVLSQLVPPTTLAILRSAEVQPIIEELRQGQGRHS